MADTAVGAQRRSARRRGVGAARSADPRIAPRSARHGTEHAAQPPRPRRAAHIATRQGGGRRAAATSGRPAGASTPPAPDAADIEHRCRFVADPVTGVGQPPDEVDVLADAEVGSNPPTRWASVRSTRAARTGRGPGIHPGRIRSRDGERIPCSASRAGLAVCASGVRPRARRRRTAAGVAPTSAPPRPARRSRCRRRTGVVTVAMPSSRATPDRRMVPADVRHRGAATPARAMSTHPSTTTSPARRRGTARATRAARRRRDGHGPTTTVTSLGALDGGVVGPVQPRRRAPVIQRSGRRTRRDDHVVPGRQPSDELTSGPGEPPQPQRSHRDGDPLAGSVEDPQRAVRPEPHVRPRSCRRRPRRRTRSPRRQPASRATRRRPRSPTDRAAVRSAGAG